MSPIQTEKNNALITDAVCAPGANVRSHHDPLFTRTLVSLLASTGAIQVCVLVQSIFIARMLGPIGRGELAAAALWPTIISGLGLLGINAGIARLTARTTDQASAIHSAVYTACATSAVAGVCGFFLIQNLPGLSNHLATLASVYLLFIPFNHLSEFLIGAYQGAGNFGRFNQMRISFYPAYFLLLGFLWVTGTHEVLHYVIAFVAAQACVILLQSRSIIRELKISRSRFPSRRLWSESRPFAFANLGNLLWQQIDKFCIMYLVGIEQLGMYVVGLSAASTLGAVTNSLGFLGFNRSAAQEPGKGFDELAEMFRQAALLSLFGGVFLALTFPVLVPAVYGRSFLPAAWLGVGLLPSAALGGLGQLLTQFLKGQGRPLLELPAKCAALLPMLVLALPHANRLGAFGVVAALTASQFIYLGSLCISARRHYNLATLRVFIPAPGDARKLGAELYATLKAVKSQASDAAGPPA